MITGQMLCDLQLALFERRDADFLKQCRQIATDIAKRDGQVSINEVRAAIQLPAELHPSVLGAVFRCNKFTAIGFTEATHKAAHARVVRIYKLKET